MYTFHFNNDIRNKLKFILAIDFKPFLYGQQCALVMPFFKFSFNKLEIALAFIKILIYF